MLNNEQNKYTYLCDNISKFIKLRKYVQLNAKMYLKTFRKQKCIIINASY